MEIFGERLTEMREVSALTRKELARRTALDGNDLRRWEECERPDVPSNAVFSLCRALRFPLAYLMRPPKRPAFVVEFFCYRDGLTPPGTYCRYCGAFSVVECDWPVGGGVTCDLPLCKQHRTHVADGPDPDGEQDIDYCPAHNDLRMGAQAPAERVRA